FDYPQRDGQRIGIVSFRDFVRYVHGGGQPHDGHWCVQATRLMLEMISYDFIGRFERFAEDFRAVLERLNAPAEVMATASQVRGQTAKICLAYVYDKEVADVVYEIYQEDKDDKDKVMTFAEIESQFESEWVLVENPQTNETLEVLSGRVRCHSKDRDEVYRKAVELRPKRFAMLYTGTIPKDTAVVL
ncbi:MAG: sulfotransferase family 2 domain-containing protein, partial [bacterium]